MLDWSHEIERQDKSLYSSPSICIEGNYFVNPEGFSVDALHGFKDALNDFMIDIFNFGIRIFLITNPAI